MQQLPYLLLLLDQAEEDQTQEEIGLIHNPEGVILQIRNQDQLTEIWKTDQETRIRTIDQQTESRIRNLEKEVKINKGLTAETEEDNLVKELHIKYGELKINMSPACIKLQHDLVHKWRNEVNTTLKTPNLSFLFIKDKTLFKKALSMLLPQLNKKKKFAKYFKKSESSNFLTYF